MSENSPITSETDMLFQGQSIRNRVTLILAAPFQNKKLKVPDKNDPICALMLPFTSRNRGK